MITMKAYYDTQGQFVHANSRACGTCVYFEPEQGGWCEIVEFPVDKIDKACMAYFRNED